MFQDLKVLKYIHLDFKCNSIFSFIYMYSGWKIISNCYMFFDSIVEIILNNWHGSQSIIQFIFIILCQTWYFKRTFVYKFSIFCLVQYILRFDALFLFKFILLRRFKTNLCNSEILLFPKFLNIVSIWYDNSYVEFIMFLCTLLAIFFTLYNEETICWILLSNFSYVLPTFTFSCATSNLWSIGLGDNVLITSLYLAPHAIVIQS